VVAPLDLADFEAIYRLRVQIEPPLAARSTALQTKASFRQLHGLLSASLQTDHEPDAQWHSHTAFHLSLVEPAASPWDLRFLEQLWDAAERYQRFAFQWREIGDEERERRAHVHLKLLDACLAGDSVAVERSVHEHLVENGDAIRAFLTDI
jgi:DNA-binding GntR family transcriptional regulator